MNALRRLWLRIKDSPAAILAAFAMFFAALQAIQARRHKEEAKKLREQMRLENAEGTSIALERAKVARQKARLNDEAARKALEKGRNELESIAEKQPAMDEIVAALRSKRVRDSADT